MKKLIILFLFSAIFITGVFLKATEANAFGECSAYGVMATYDILSDSCKCMSGYVFQDDFLGNPQCVSATSVCYGEYGYGSRYNSLTNSCECSYGYVFGKDSLGRTQCITETQACKNQLGYGARATFGGKCECGYGEIIQGGQCVSGDLYCSSKHGLHSSYNDSSNTCECDYGYTLGENGQCREKENNVYFKLLDLNTGERQAIIKSEYDSSRYLVTYGLGCRDYSFERYLGKNIVVNLGTDFYVDRWDTIVLPNHDQVCDIRSEERTFYDSFEEMYPEEENLGSVGTYYYSPPTTTYTYQNTTNQDTNATQNTSVKEKVNKDFTVPDGDVVLTGKVGRVNTSASLRSCPSVDCSLIQYLEEGQQLSVVGEYSRGDWYSVALDSSDSGKEGWVYNTLIEVESSQAEPSVEEETTLTKRPNIFIRVWKGVRGWFR